MDKEAMYSIFKSKRKDLDIIFLLASKKNVSLEDKNKKQSFIRRNLRPAKFLVPYDLVRIEEVMDWLKENVDFKWTLETAGKFIDEDLEKLSQKSIKEEAEIPNYAKNQ